MFCNLHFPLHSPSALPSTSNILRYASPSASGASHDAETDLLGTLLVKIEHILVQTLGDYSYALKCHFLPLSSVLLSPAQICNMISTSHLCRLFSHLEFYGDSNTGKKEKTECALLLIFSQSNPWQCNPCFKLSMLREVPLSFHKFKPRASALQIHITVITSTYVKNDAKN